MVGAREVIAFYDKDGDGQLSPEEIRPYFLEFIKPTLRGNSESEFDVWFNKRDLKKDGKLEKRELEVYFAQNGFKPFKSDDIEKTKFIIFDGVKYYHQREIGAGSFGVVQLYIDEKGTKIAVKISKDNE